MKIPRLNYEQLIAALKRDGWVVVRQRGSHIRLLTIPAHRPIKRSTLSHILTQARLSAEQLDELL